MYVYIVEEHCGQDGKVIHDLIIGVGASKEIAENIIKKRIERLQLKEISGNYAEEEHWQNIVGEWLMRVGYNYMPAMIYGWRIDDYLLRES